MPLYHSATLSISLTYHGLFEFVFDFAKQPIKRFGRQFVFDDDFARTQRRVEQNGEEKRRVLLRFLADKVDPVDDNKPSFQIVKI